MIRPIGIVPRRCGGCRFFTGTPAALERAVPGLTILSSAYGSVRGNTGLCERDESFVTSIAAACPDYRDRDAEAEPAARAPRRGGFPDTP